jgi:predicted N-acyltransferase
MEVSEEYTWSQDESALFADSLFDNFAHFLPYSSARTTLSIAKVRRGDKLIGVAPLTRLVKYRGTRLLKPGSRRWMDPLLGPFVCNTLCMIDANLMAFRHADPFIALNASDAVAVREAVITYLKHCNDVDSILISEPAADPSWLHSAGFFSFKQLPMVRIEVGACASFDDYLASIGSKRRRNLRQERKLFAKAGVRVEVIAPPLETSLAEKLHQCLLGSALRNKETEVPFEDVLNSHPAFLTQRQWAIVARLGDTIVGFFAFIPYRGIMAQCHGGLDYRYSLPIKAYPNLIHAAVEYAIESGFDEVTLGPLNNEAKRRAGIQTPVMSSCWCRSPFSQLFMNKVIGKRLQIYTGELRKDSYDA